MYTTSIVVLIWARYNVFATKSEGEKRNSTYYDPIASIHLVVSTVFIFAVNPANKAHVLLCSVLTILGIGLFAWALLSTTKLKYALASSDQQIVTSGAFAFSRHPYYLSYALIWSGTTILFNSLILWITLTYMLAFYIFSAKREENSLIQGAYSREYKDYKSNVGMFFPRVTKWINWILER